MGCNTWADGISLMISCCSFLVSSVVCYYFVHVQVPCIYSIHVSELSRDRCLALSCLCLASFHGMNRLCWSLPSLWFVVHMVDSLSFIPIVHCVLSILPWALSIELLFALDSLNCLLPHVEPVRSSRWCDGVRKFCLDPRDFFCQFAPHHISSLGFFIDCGMSFRCFTWPFLRSFLSLFDNDAQLASWMMFVVYWGTMLSEGWGVLEYGCLSSR